MATETAAEKKARLAKLKQKNSDAEKAALKKENSKNTKTTEKELTTATAKDTKKKAKIVANSKKNQTNATAKFEKNKKAGTLGDSKWKKAARTVTKFAKALTPAVNVITGNKDKAAKTAADRKNNDDNTIDKKPPMSDKRKARRTKREGEATTRYQKRTKRRTARRDRRVANVGTAGFGKQGYSKRN
tara:strand:+ start:132 stop:692 length:561 start_codon:yes stop_codon:yes gene_type:complete